MEKKQLKDIVIVEFTIVSGVQDENGIYANTKIKRQALGKSYAEKIEKEDAEKAEMYNSKPLVKILGDAYEYFDRFNGNPRLNLLTLEEIEELEDVTDEENSSSETKEPKEKAKAGRKPKLVISDNSEKIEESLDV